MRVATAAVLLSLSALTACGPGSSSTDSAQAPRPKDSTGPVITERPQPAKPQGPIWFEPAALKACGRPERITVHWNVGSLPDVKAVDILGVRKDGGETLFLAAGRSGSRETGAWMRGGSEMILRNKANGLELGRARVETLSCN